MNRLKNMRDSFMGGGTPKLCPQNWGEVGRVGFGSV